MNFYQLWPERWVKRVSCPQFLSFFSQPCSQISPHLNLSLQQVLNHHLHQTCITNIKLSFPYVPAVNYYQLWPDKRVRRLSCFWFWSFFHHLVPRFPHIWTKVSSKLSTNICTEHAKPISNCPFYMYPLWTIFISDLKEGLEGCPVLRFGLFSPLCVAKSPHI